MRHPFELIPPARRKTLFWFLLALTLAVMALMNLVGAPLINLQAPLGIVSFELAGSVSRASEIIASWDARAQRYAAFGLGLDYVFMLAYASTISLACLWAGQVLRSHGWPLSSAARPLAWGQWLAAVLDALENLSLTIILLEVVRSPWPELARVCAVLKFGLIFLGLVYAFLALAVSLLHRLKS
jgi:hypothetical protein